MLKRYVYLFEEAKGFTRFELGGKGYGLVEMSAAGLPVPPGFVITTEACREYYRNNGRFPEGLIAQVAEKLRQLEAKTGKRLGDHVRPLLVSVRSGAPYSMPGMMDTILNVGLNDEVVNGLAKSTGNERFAYDAYRRLLQMFGRIVLGVHGEKFEAVLREHKEREGAKHDHELSVGSLKSIIHEFKRIIREHSGREFPQDPWEQIQMAVEAVFRSWNNPRAVEYRRYYKIADDIGTAVNVQVMVFGNLGPDSGTGVGFTRDPSTGEKRLYGEYLPNSQGEDVVAGIRTPMRIDSVDPHLKRRLHEVADLLEKHFKDMQDFEFTVESGQLYILQTRNGKRTAQAAVRIAVDMVREGLITVEEALMRVESKELTHLLYRRLDPRAKIDPIARGLNASPGVATGKVVFDVDEAVQLASRKERVILVRPETTPDDIRGIIASQGVLTSRGGMTSHAAVVTRGMGKPAVVGCESIRIDLEREQFVTESGLVVKKGDVVTIDGSTGYVMLGEVPTVEPEMTEELRTLLRWANEVKRLGIRANADTPEAARKAREFGAEGIGLCRTERMFNAPDRLPIVREMIMAASVEERRRALEKLFPLQLGDFKEIFRAMKGLPVTVRLLDLPLHEFLPPQEVLLTEIYESKLRGVPDEQLAEKTSILKKVEQIKEHNPMIGHRGCRLAVTYPEIYRMQVRAILRAAIEVLREEGETAEVQIMMPQTSMATELAYLRKLVDETAEQVFTEMGTRIHYKFGTMIETPRAALTAAEIARHVDFFSFGTNDLTQTTFAFSRDDAEAKFLAPYLEKGLLKENPFEVLDQEGVGRLVRIATEEGRSSNPRLEVGICGEHGGEPKSIEFFHSAGLNYVSCSPFRIPIARLAAARAALKGKVVQAVTV
ncbi:MAG: pyruvate, phosphate dikinase [Thaumarchaeota archaeon]|nr:pyruvate, phosphate dikinase [Candidatus Calditenuaceae archaeon]MDW8186937.1 pyruvate, phosphate dikinase [Nitrososphaerota archaeon]